MGHKRGGLLAILAVAFVTLGLVFGASSTAYADFSDLITNDTEVTISEVSGKTWYVIAEDSSTVTLLSKQSFGNTKFHDSSNNYAGSTVKTYVEGLTGDGRPLAGIKDVLADASVTDPAVTGKVPYLLSVSEVNGLSVTKRKGDNSEWWLRSPGTRDDTSAALVESGEVLAMGRAVMSSSVGVRPALKLNLSSVTFSSGSNTFTVRSGPDKSALNDAITAAQALYDSIKDNADYADIATTLQTAIGNATTVANDDSAEQDTVDTATTTITTARTTAVVGMINKLPAASDVTTSDKVTIEAVRAAYASLSETEQGKVDANTLKKLTDAETALATAEVKAAIEALPAAKDITAANKEAVQAAKAAYDKLSDAQKEEVGNDAKAKLDACMVALAIAELPAPADITAANKDAVQAARKAYDALSDAQKTAVGADALAKLETVEAALAIAELPAATDITTGSKDAIEAARAAYDKLSDAQKEQLGNDAKQKLEEAEVALVNKVIEALPEAGAVTTDSKEAIDAARKAYDALSDAQKGQVDANTLKKLTDAETALATAEVKAAIEALPAAKDITAANKEAVQAAKAAYDKLSDAQKEEVGNDAKAKLDACMAALAIAELPAPADITAANKDAVQAARRAYDALSDGQKEVFPAEALKRLEAAEVALKKAEKAATGKEMYRLYNPNSGEHFYTANAAERDNVVAAGWTYEGVGWTAPAASETPVFRLYNAIGGEHHYTTDASERDMLVSAGWNDEGTGWYSDDAQGVPVYREYNPNQFACNHNYTASLDEHEHLVSIGWNDEGVGWYGVAN